MALDRNPSFGVLLPDPSWKQYAAHEIDMPGLIPVEDEHDEHMVPEVVPFSPFRPSWANRLRPRYELI